MQNTILHLDMDSFFASVEQQGNPRLAGKPIGVIKEKGRTVIIAASREAKKLGIKTGTTTYEAKRIYPKIILVPADFDKYFSVTKKFVEICSRYSPDLEVFSIDELFLEVAKTKNFFGGVSGIVRRIKEDMRRELGEHITCSIGISYNKLLAKLASGINKPNGVFEITPENKDQVLFSCRLSDVCGLGLRLESRLRDCGITNFKALREIPLKYLEASFGPFWARELKRLSFGEDNSLLTRLEDLSAGGQEMKSVSRTFTLYENTTNLRIIKATLRNLCEEASWKAREMGMRGREVGVMVRGEEGSGMGEVGEGRVGRKGEEERDGDYRHKTLKYFIESGGDLFEIVWKLFEEMRWAGSIRSLGVWLGGLKPKSELTQSLLPEEKRKENLIKAMDKVNQKFGELTLYPAVLLQGKKIKSEVNGFLGDKAFRFSVSHSGL